MSRGSLSDIKRHLVLPTGLTSTGWPAVRDRCRDLGITFDPWQDGAGRAMLGKRANGKYAATVGGVVLSIPRQVGKTFLLGSIVFALCLETPGITVIWTAHRTRTAGEVFLSMQGLARREKIAPHIDRVVLGSGDEEIRFTNGSRILFGARERGFGRGFSKVNILVFDEAQILTDNAIDDMVPATNTVENALVLYCGTPPKPTDNGEVFTRKRTAALSGASTDMVYLELGAPPGSDPDDRDAWRQANPSYPGRTPEESMLRMRASLSDEAFLREALGIWDDDAGAAVVSAEAWKNMLSVDSLIVGRAEFCLDVSPSLTSAALCAAGRRADTKWHIQVTHRDNILDHRAGIDWLTPRLTQLKDGNRNFKLWIVPGGGESLVPTFKDERIPFEVMKVADVAKACGFLFAQASAVPTQLRHPGQKALTSAVMGAARVDVGDGAFKWARRKSSTDITPLYAATGALWAASKRRNVSTIW